MECGTRCRELATENDSRLQERSLHNLQEEKKSCRRILFLDISSPDL